METPIATNAKIYLSFLNLKFSQEVNGSTETRANVEVKKEMKYFLCVPLIKSVGKGTLDIKLAPEGLSSYVSLEGSTQGKSDTTLKER